MGKRIVIDVDGVLADDSDPEVEYANREAYPFAVEFVKKLKEAGHKIIIQTARYMMKYDGNQENAKYHGIFELRCWLQKYDIPYDEIYMGKASGSYYLDDRAIKIKSNEGEGDWDRFLKTVGVI